MAEEKRDELEKLIEKQKGKLKPKEAAGEAAPEIPQRKPVEQPAAPQMPQQPLTPPPGFSGMQTSIMEQPAQIPSQPLAQPQQPPTTPQPQMPQQQPQMAPPPIPTTKEEPEEEIATLQEPSLPVAQLAYNRTNIEDIELLIESVVEEKWRQAMESFGDINLWKERARTEIVSIKQELLRLEQRFENMEKAMIGKVHEYDKNVLNVGAELKAMEKVMQKIMQPLIQNVRELEKLTKKIKK